MFALQDLVIVYSSRVSQYIIGNVQPTYYILLEPACHWSQLLLILKIVNYRFTEHWAQIVMMSWTRRGSYNDGDNWPLTLSSDLVRAVWVQGGGLRSTGHLWRPDQSLGPEQGGGPPEVWVQESS